MSNPATSSELRTRARRLRDLAATIERTPAMSLDQAAGDDTWRGRRPLLCHNVLVANLAQLHGAVDDLRWRGWQLERQASEIDAAAGSMAAGSTAAVATAAG